MQESPACSSAPLFFRCAVRPQNSSEHMLILARVRPHNQIADEARIDEEAQRQADHRKYDQDNDQRLDFEEFKAMVQKKSPKMSDEALKELFDEMDRNRDGSISLKEYNHMRSPKMRALRLVKSESMKKIYKSVMLLAAYVLLGVFVFPQLEEGWTHTDALYFSMATMSTVGYGDISPSTDSARVFTMFMIFFGLLFVFVEVANVIGFITMPLTKWCRPPAVFPRPRILALALALAVLGPTCSSRAAADSTP